MALVRLSHDRACLATELLGLRLLARGPAADIDGLTLLRVLDFVA